MIDWSRIEELKSEVGAEDFEEVVEIFLEEVDETIAKFPDAKEPAQMEELMHFLKGSALNIGFSGLSDICAKGETLARAGTMDGIDTARVEEVYQSSKAALIASL